MQEKQLTEQEAYIALIAGKEGGLAYFFNRYYSPISFYSQSITNNQHASEEIASEAFVKLWKRKDKLSDCRKIRFLLYRIVYNASIDYLRRQKVLEKSAKDLYRASELSERGALDKLIEVETYNQLHLLLQNLPARSRQIFQKFYFEKKTNKEIAGELGISINTVKTLKGRALQTLKQYRGSLYPFTVYPLIFT